MRSLILLLVALVAIPAQAQSRIFRASDVDLQQDSRIQVLEIQVEALQKVVAEFSRPIPTPDPLPNAEPEPVIQIPPDNTKYVQLGDLKEINGKVHRLTEVGDGVRWMPTQSSVSQQTTVTTTTRPASNRLTTSELKSIAASYRGPMEALVEPRSWAREHLQNDHGFSLSQVAGLTIDEAVTIHSMAHGGRVSPYRSAQTVVTSPPVVSQSTVTRERPFSSVERSTTIYQPGCPNGQCPTARSQSTTRYRTPFFGRRR